MNIKYSILYILGVFIAAYSQILLKKSAVNNKNTGIRFYLNFFVLFAYFLFFGCTLLSIVALRVIPLSLGAFYGALGYVFVPVLSFFLLKESLTKKQLFGIGFIITGVIITSVF
nr:EamA family transporter [Treponema primitia]